MADFTYTATRSLKSGHTIDTDYTITSELMRLDGEMPNPEKVVHRTLGGAEVTVLFYIDTKLEVTTDYINSDGTGTPDTADYLEFLHSVAGGEQFEFDNGTPVNVVMEGNPTRTRTGTKFNYSFTMRVVE